MSWHEEVGCVGLLSLPRASSCDHFAAAHSPKHEERKSEFVKFDLDGDQQLNLSAPHLLNGTVYFISRTMFLMFSPLKNKPVLRVHADSEEELQKDYGG